MTPCSRPLSRIPIRVPVSVRARICASVIRVSGMSLRVNRTMLITMLIRRRLLLRASICSRLTCIRWPLRFRITWVPLMTVTRMLSRLTVRVLMSRMLLRLRVMFWVLRLLVVPVSVFRRVRLLWSSPFASIRPCTRVPVRARRRLRVSLFVMLLVPLVLVSLSLTWTVCTALLIRRVCRRMRLRRVVLRARAFTCVSPSLTFLCVRFTVRSLLMSAIAIAPSLIMFLAISLRMLARPLWAPCLMSVRLRRLSRCVMRTCGTR